MMCATAAPKTFTMCALHAVRSTAPKLVFCSVVYRMLCARFGFVCFDWLPAFAVCARKAPLRFCIFSRAFFVS